MGFDTLALRRDWLWPIRSDDDLPPRDAPLLNGQASRRSMSEPPRGGGATVGKVGAMCAGADSAVEMLAELGMMLTDPADRLADRAGHSDPGTLGRG
jgi:hypothetical protein